jgi:hypothetical protein
MKDAVVLFHIRNWKVTTRNRDSQRQKAGKPQVQNSTKKKENEHLSTQTPPNTAFH